jgi:hypothetical protein
VSRAFQYLNAEWNAELTGMSHGVASGFPPDTTSWSVEFKPINDPLSEPVHGVIWKSDLTQLSDDDLRECLKVALAKASKDPNLKK